MLGPPATVRQRALLSAESENITQFLYFIKELIEKSQVPIQRFRSTGWGASAAMQSAGASQRSSLWYSGEAKAFVYVVALLKENRIVALRAIAETADREC
jgi:hypothetical protein